MVSQSRIAIVSTPRSGNTWLRHLLSALFDLAPFAVHNPADLDWDALPDRAVLQLHWHPTQAFRSQLETHGFRVVTIYRHPLDVLISILQFSQGEPQTARWLEGEGGDERGILAAMPRSEAFRRYASSRRARALLSVSPEWSAVPGTCTLRYEDLVSDTAGQLEALAAALGEPPTHPVRDVVEAHTLPRMRTITQRPDHFWRGSPGTWQRLLDRRSARSLSDVLPRFRMYEVYSGTADRRLKPSVADQNWLDIVRFATPELAPTA